MLCAEWWFFEVIALLSGVFGSLQLTAMAIVLQIANLEFMFIYGVSIGISTRVSNLLGAGLPYDARFSARSALILGLIVLSFTIFITLLLRHYLGYIFTSDREANVLVADLLPLVLMFSFFDGIQGIISGIVRGMGQQTYGATINLVGYWCLCLPCSVFFAFHLGFKDAGLCSGITVGLVFVCIGLIALLKPTNWEEEAKKAAIRTGKDSLPYYESYGSMDKQPSDSVKGD